MGCDKAIVCHQSWLSFLSYPGLWQLWSYQVYHTLCSLSVTQTEEVIVGVKWRWYITGCPLEPELCLLNTVQPGDVGCGGAGRRPRGFFCFVQLLLAKPGIPQSPPPPSSLPSPSWAFLRHSFPPCFFLLLFFFFFAEGLFISAASRRLHAWGHIQRATQAAAFRLRRALFVVNPRRGNQSPLLQIRGRGRAHTETKSDGVFMYVKSTMHVDDWTLLLFKWQ